MQNVVRKLVTYEVEVRQLYVDKQGEPAMQTVICTQSVGPANLSERQARKLAVEAYGGRLPRNSVVLTLPLREDTYAMSLDDFIENATVVSSVDAE